jgi:toxin ParE1/3/4
MKFLLSDYIDGDLDEIATYIARDSPRYALLTIQKIRREFRIIGAAPYHFRLRPELREELRLAMVGQYAILFRVVNETVRIERVLHGMRDLPERILP